METDYIIDSKGNKFKIKTSVGYGAMVTSVVLPELKAVDNMCIAPDGYIFAKWRDPEYRRSEVLMKHRLLAIADILREGILLPNVDKLYGFIHYSNKHSSDWALRNGSYIDGEVDIDGTKYDKYICPVENLLKIADSVK